MSVGCSHTEPYVPGGLDPAGPPLPPPDSIIQRIVLIGDAGAPSVEGEPVLSLLRDSVGAVPTRTTVVYLGDNIYPAGLPAETAPSRAGAERALLAQVNAAGSARAVFVPGNHDWANAKSGGLEAITRMSLWLDAFPNAELSPTAGCPGPEFYELPGVRLITLDTQWWLHEHERGSGCAQADTAQVLGALAEALETQDGRPAVVVAHHPLESRGPHGGFFTLGEWIFPAHMANGKWRWILLPLPGVGPLVRWFVRTDQDFVSSGNSRMRHRIADVLRANPPLAYAAGHDHSLQVFDGGDLATLLMVSGLGSSEKATSVGSNEQTLFADQHSGFMVFDFLPGRTLLRVMEPKPDPVVYWREFPLGN